MSVPAQTSQRGHESERLDWHMAPGPGETLFSRRRIDGILPGDAQRKETSQETLRTNGFFIGQPGRKYCHPEPQSMTRQVFPRRRGAM